MRYRASQTHKNLEEPGRFWYVVDQHNNRLGYGFVDCETEIQAMQIANELNTAYAKGILAAQATMRQSLGL